jgi:hypothetical protein
VDDPLSVVKEMDVDKGLVIMHLGNDAGIGRVVLGSHQEFEFVQSDSRSDDTSTNGSKMTYTPLMTDSIVQSNELSHGKIRLNGEVIVDFVRGYKHGDVYIRLQQDG